MTGDRERVDPASQEGLAATRDVLLRVDHVLAAGLRGRAVRGTDVPLLRSLCARLGELIQAAERVA